ncbi:DUF177 domain-containing protein [Desulfovibrio sp. OttesenSCG-928-C06]|nr:DUF177 domain-containing protein [Desulfovibrio sp. OttesenSCG-928-C06]
MYSTWAPLQAILNTGPHYILEDQSIWTGPIEEFKIPCRISGPVKAEFDIFPQEDGLLIRGKITGQVTVPCSRCAEDAVHEIRHEFDSFEPLPADDEAEDAEPDPDIDEYFIRYSPQGTGLEVNLGALAWEEFAQTLPVHPLCTQNCAGLCPKCGKNLNNDACECEKEDYDPRMAKLRGLKINK